MHGVGQLYPSGTTDLDIAKQRTLEQRAAARDAGKARRHRARHSKPHGPSAWLHLRHQRHTGEREHEDRGSRR